MLNDTMAAIAGGRVPGHVYIDFEYVEDSGYFFFQAEDGIRDLYVTGVQTCALPISRAARDGLLRRSAAGAGGMLAATARDHGKSVHTRRRPTHPRDRKSVV